MATRKKFQQQITVFLTKDQLDYLHQMIEKGEAENISQAIRKIINKAREKT